jgi:hypothetical protein
MTAPYASVDHPDNDNSAQQLTNAKFFIPLPVLVSSG